MDIRMKNLLTKILFISLLSSTGIAASQAAIGLVVGPVVRPVTGALAGGNVVITRTKEDVIEGLVKVLDGVVAVGAVATVAVAAVAVVGVAAEEVGSKRWAKVREQLSKIYYKFAQKTKKEK